MIVACPSCGQKNRVRPDKLDAGKCGSCEASLASPDAPIEADPATFDALIAGDRPVLVDFWAPWCAPCRRAAPEVAAAAKTLAGRAIVLKLDTQQHPVIASRYGITGIPYFAVFRQGKRVADQTGLVPAARLVALVP